MIYRLLPICVVLLARYSVAQAPDRFLRFEVASVRSANPGPGPMRVVIYGGPGSSDSERFTALNATLLMLITNAYDVPSNQLDGPSWLRTERFDISARVPPGTTKSQFSNMLKNLLADRFKLAVHEEERQATVFALVVDKKGLKMKQSVITPLTGSDHQSAPSIGKDGIPVIPSGAVGLWRNVVDGRVVIQGRHQTLANLAGILSDQLMQPVTDETAVTNFYDFTLDFWPQPLGAEDSQAEETGPSVFSAVQRLGLRLDSRKRLVHTLVIDHLEKAATAN